MQLYRHFMHIPRFVLHIDTYKRQHIVEMKDINRLNNMREFDKEKHVHFIYSFDATNMVFGNSYLLNFFSALLPKAGHGLLINEFSKSHTATHYSR
jgi:hypothetical protein